MSHDYSAFQAPQSNDALAQLTLLAQQQIAAEAEVARVEAELKVAQQKLRDVQEIALPDLMESLGFKDFTLSNGRKIELSDKIYASIPKEQHEPAIGWLRDHNHAALIKNEVKCQFSKGQEEVAKAVIAKITEYAIQNQLIIPLENKETVHPSTLSAFVRQALKAGEELPHDLLGINRKRVTEIK